MFSGGSQPSFSMTRREVIKAPARERAYLDARPHLKWVEGVHRGYMVLDVTPDRIQNDWYFVPTVDERTDEEAFVKGFVSEAGNPHLVETATPAG